MTVIKTKAERIAEAQAQLFARRKADPDGALRVDARLARLTAAKKHERERIDLLVLGGDRPPAIKTKTKVRGKRRTSSTPAPIEPEIDRALSLREAWSHKKGTPETMAHAERTHQGALAQLVANGTIDANQLEWAAQIANVHRSIASGVDVAVASLEARVDQSTRAPAVAERIHRVRMHAAYTLWRSLLPAPKSLVLDMIVGDAIGYTVAARRHRVHNRKAKRRLVEAVLRWPVCVMHVFSIVDECAVDAMNMAHAPKCLGAWTSPVLSAKTYEQARNHEGGRDTTDESYLLPAVDPVFLDGHGRFRPWNEIAKIIREKAFGEVNVSA